MFWYVYNLKKHILYYPIVLITLPNVLATIAIKINKINGANDRSSPTKVRIQPINEFLILIIQYIPLIIDRILKTIWRDSKLQKMTIFIVLSLASTGPEKRKPTEKTRNMAVNIPEIRQIKDE
jgi:hypothetical protein